MKQRKKIKYVQKQPPDKLNEQKNIQIKQENNQYNQKKVEKPRPKEQTYLISSQQDKGYKKEENKSRYIAKETQKETITYRSDYTRNYYGGQPQSEKLNPPKFVERQSSHLDMHCIICSELIHRKDFIWTCSCCCISMHLRCIKQWIKSVNEKQDKKNLHLFNWKCPQCNFQYNQPMPKYYCFCGKHLNPEVDRDLSPHSCGEICNKKRGPYCTHPCPDICHKAKCQPCEHEGMLIVCQCGKSQRMAKCSQERVAFQCGKKCEKVLNCNKHKCEKNCHAGPCQPCKKKKMASCYCGKGTDVVDCSVGAYSCGQVCQKKLNCGFHKCENKCHFGQCSPCQKTPELQKTCPCGKYEIQMLTGDPQYRKSCQDNIPVCGMPCSLKLQCGHICPRSCHEGLCATCKVIVDQACVCGSKARKIQCAQKAHQQFKCQSICKKKRACGKHICNTVCCPHRNSPILADHPCQFNCNKMLNCGKHQCGQPCHMGLCKKCPVVYSQPQPCPCGKTFLKPPIICGTLTPECQNVCGKELECGHKCQNICHYGPCKCYESVIISCRCRKQKIKTTCGRQALCLTKCHNFLACGHKCDIQCHLGTCEQAHKTNPCRKICGKERTNCKHTCPQLCHPGQQCQSFPCQAEVLVKCECGHRQTMIVCGAQDNHITKKSIMCNKKCQNKKRFAAFYENKQIYYPGNLVQFAFKNFPYLQNIEAKLQKFILHSEQNFIQIQYKFPDNQAKLLLTNLFQNHYHLNTHFYRHGKYATFSLMQSQNTMVPKPVLTEYIKLISKGIVKQNNLPFEFTISFEMQQKDKTELIIRSLKEFLHKYYSERSGKHISLHFWSREDGEQALDFLEKQFQTVQFKCSQNITKPEEEVGQQDIVQTQQGNQDEQDKQEKQQNDQKEKTLQKKEEFIKTQKIQSEENAKQKKTESNKVTEQLKAKQSEQKQLKTQQEKPQLEKIPQKTET